MKREGKDDPRILVVLISQISNSGVYFNPLPSTLKASMNERAIKPRPHVVVLLRR